MIKAQDDLSRCDVKVEQKELKLQWRQTSQNVKTQEDSSFEKNLYAANLMEKASMLKFSKGQVVVKMEDQSFIEIIQYYVNAGSNQPNMNFIQKEDTVKVEEKEFPEQTRPQQTIPKHQIGENGQLLELIKNEAIVKTEEDGFIDKKKRNLNSGKKKARKRRENWRPDQNLRYLNFISHPPRRVELEAVSKKEKQRIFNHMSAKIQSRTSRQCKSHHQKMLMKHGIVEEIIKGLMREESVEKDQRKGLSRIALKCKQQA